ncbi:MAG: aminotransferase class IV [Candidatus Promineifilaceae bacterium]
METLQLFAVGKGGPRPLPVPAGAAEIHDLVAGRPLGVYTALRSYRQNHFLCLNEHLDRLERSMAWLGWSERLDRPLLRRALHEVSSRYPLPEARLRIDVLAPAGEGAPLEAGRLLIGLAPFRPPPAEAYTQGVRAAIAPGLRRARPLVKSAQFVAQRRPAQAADPAVYEWLLLDDDGHILEGVTSNFYAVRDGALWTAGRGVLEGIARLIVLRVAEVAGVPVRLQPVPLAELDRFSEAALSSASRAILPIVQIGDKLVGAGRPGPVVRTLLTAYNQEVARLIRPAIE